MTPPRVVVAGGLRIDYLISTTGQVTLRQCGGNGLYSAVGARVWGAAVGLLGRVGQNYPRAWLDQAQAAGIDTAGVHWLSSDAEMRTFFAHHPHGGRVEGDPAFHFGRLGLPVPPDLLTYHQPDADQEDAVYRPLWLTPADLPPAYSAAQAFHLAPMNWESHLGLVRALRGRGGLVSLDPGERYMTAARRAEVADLLAGVEVFLPSELETTPLLGEVSPLEAARWFAAHGPRVVVLKQGGRGVLVYDRPTDRFYHAPPVPTTIRDVTGAGDAFCGGFLVGWLETGDPVQAARYGAVSASLALEDFGALYALRYGRADAEARLPHSVVHPL